MRIASLPVLLFATAALSAAGQAQTFSTVAQPQSDADALAAAVRTLGANPRDIDALVTAGELSLRLGDASAAAAFFARAEKVDPRSGRMKAGEAALLVHEERPGEALRYFDQAVRYGIDPARFAAERGLAYDLIGEPDRAQRDYRLALRTGGDNPEVVRRYALSLGISGKRELALQLLDPLLRTSDRGAWRARAFILAMTGDVAGANTIAKTMMPPGMASGLQPFFERLPALASADRAFAVHFGEVRATPERLADARMVPVLPALAPDPTAPVAVAAQPAVPATQVASRTETKRGTRRAAKAAQAKPPAYALQTVQPLPGVTTQAAKPQRAAPPPTAPAPVAPVRTSPVTASPPAAAPAVSQPPQAAPVQVAAVPVPNVPQASRFSTTFAESQARWEAEKRAERRRAVEASANVAATPAPGAPRSLSAPPSTNPAAPASSATVSAPTSPATPPIQPAARAASPSPPVATVEPGPATLRQPIPAAAVSTPETAATAAPATSAANAAPPRLAGDSILAKIIANITIPDSELAPRAAAALPTPQRAVIDKVAADRKAAADKKALAAKKEADAKAAADKKAAADRKAAEEKLAKADPPRIWVQVAGGANAADLAKAWKSAQAKAAALKGKTPYSTPLRATNRLVTGPFKTDDEAQALVNTLARQGVSAFTFTSAKGQKLTRIGGQ